MGESIKERAIRHCSARWDLCGRMGWQGNLTREIYVSANTPTVMQNIREGFVPDYRGTGTWPDRQAGES